MPHHPQRPKTPQKPIKPYWTPHRKRKMPLVVPIQGWPLPRRTPPRARRSQQTKSFNNILFSLKINIKLTGKFNSTLNLGMLQRGPLSKMMGGYKKILKMALKIKKLAKMGKMVQGVRNWRITIKRKQKYQIVKNRNNKPIRNKKKIMK